eukprot:m.433016 g.433016  ORF g.433016 m.433016 type:complete len:179 (+) comp17518_c0_seq1:220-756(+)
MAQLHVIGELVGGKDFPSCDLFCKFGLVTGPDWRLLEGHESGQTQVDHPTMSNMAQWSHPIDVHYATKGVQGWPKIHLEVWHHDTFGRSEIYGYGFCHVPTTPGMHTVDVATWRPVGNVFQQAQSYFVGGGLQLRAPELVYTGVDRPRLQTEAMGTVVLELGVITHNFENYGVETVST